ATPTPYTPSLHDALPICSVAAPSDLWLSDGAQRNGNKSIPTQTGQNQKEFSETAKAPSRSARPAYNTFQMSSAYSRMVLSDENQPVRAVLSTAERHQLFGSRQRASTSSCACQ